MAKKKSKTRTFEGLPVVDGTDELILHITPNDVKSAKKNDPASCAAAKAGARELKTDVRVFLSRTYVKQKDHWVRYVTPEATQREIVSFDRGATFEPGEYYVRPVSPTERLGIQSGRGPHRKTGKPTKPRHVTGMIRSRSTWDNKKGAK